MKRLFSFTLVCLCLSYELDGQSSLNIGRVNPSGGVASTTLLVGGHESEAISKIEGNPYLIDEFLSTDMVIEVNGKQQNTNFYAKFNIFNNNFEVKHEEEIKYLDASIVREFEHMKGDKKIKFIHAGQFQKAGFDGDGFLQLLSEGKAQLLSQEAVTVTQVSRGGFGVPDEISEKFYREKSYFILVSDQFYEFKSFTNSSLKIFEDKTDQVKEFVKAKKLKFKNEEHIKNIVDYFNSL
ncbi:hypothetical protein [uncultured Roseivirga sp.]|uniref:hypothetical protein n=1 Tax=uncultured Roseivirga sp. TaxID=543088 RepID=UPI0030D863E2|tara:strand:- start:11881 stop:12594 length:714 start_codon:yes stop_codon:yes gene_type:complete